MRLELSMAKIANGGFLCTAIEETQYVIKKPRTQVREEKKRGVEFPGHTKVKSAMEGHPAMIHQNHTDGCHSYQIAQRGIPRHAGGKMKQVLLHQSHADIRHQIWHHFTWNATCATRSHSGNPMIANRRFASRKCAYICSSSEDSTCQCWCIRRGYHTRRRFWSSIVDWRNNIMWLVHYLLCMNAANIHFEDKRSLLNIHVHGNQHWLNGTGFLGHYNLQFADTVKYILKNIFICIIKEQYADHGQSTWRLWNGCQNIVNDKLCQIERLHIADTLVAKWASTQHQQL